jgi:hypothetical protein
MAFLALVCHDRAVWILHIEAWLNLVLVALFGLLLFLRMKFPKASRRSETAVLLSATILFFLICNSFLPLRNPPRATDRLTENSGEAFQAMTRRG